MPDLKTAYVETAHAARGLLSRTGVLEVMQRSDSMPIRHLRSLFAIHDVEDLVTLDLPWWTYRAIRVVERFLGDREAKVFEYGCGASTVWLARRAARVDAVEHDKTFADVVTDLVTRYPHTTVRSCPTPVSSDPTAIRSQRRGQEDRDFTQYVHAIDDVDGVFDLIVVDGRARLDCLLHAHERLAPDGLILFDDLHRARYKPALALDGFEARVFTGAKPCLPYPNATALLRRAAEPSPPGPATGHRAAPGSGPG